MTPDQRIAELEQQLMELRKVAVSMVVGIADAVAETPEQRDKLAQTFLDVAQSETGELERLSRLVATALQSRS